ncbi:glutamate-cysteine ligase family protein [Dictyobacter aurantiacus]|uniref:glutamate--cysteine ligase n=1 Tax=Dictyobacter aurantiacus TaxID=1936993 RepID=A0A401ZSF1_9CHLR|nr:glutamate-cysteine ligase family protein [Dictyobacter aurantiacus]GCE09783.1 hypothetical protein KDAU_71120 [Dictyobacter aurantiacus]
MLTIEQIMRYHSKIDVPISPKKVGIELELFCINGQNNTIVPYQVIEDGISVQNLIGYLMAYKGFSISDFTKTFELKKGQTKITLEPGAQFEFCSAPHEYLTDLLRDLHIYNLTLQELADEFKVYWLDVSYFPVGKPSDVSLIPNPRYETMHNYFQRTGKLGRDIMCYTGSLQITFDYDSLQDLEEKVNRALLLKPIFLFLTANSRLREGKDTGLRSFRTITYRNTDSSRMGTPGSEEIWNSGRWTLLSYIQKVLKAPVMFSLREKYTYQETDNKAFDSFMEDSSLSDYLFHNSTIWTDIRVRQYFEIRYLDNPGIKLIPGIIILLYTLIYNPTLWSSFLKEIPYSFNEVPQVVDLLNTASEVSDDYWKNKLMEPFMTLTEHIQRNIEPSLSLSLDPIKDKIVNYKSSDDLLNLGNDKDILYYFKRNHYSIKI